MSETLKTDDSLTDKDEVDSVLATKLAGSGEGAALHETEEEMDTTPGTDSKTASFTTDNSVEESTEGGTAEESEGEMRQTNIEFITERLSSMIADKINTNQIKTKKKKDKTNARSNDNDGDKVQDSDEETDDSDASDVLCINQSDDEGDLENKLEEKASRNNLTASNVKSILHQVITNKDVVEMVKNTLTIFEEAQSQDAGRTGNVYEPKMTRSKMKEVIEQGKMPQVWPLTPVKNNTRSKPSFLEMQFTDDEDEEYNPEKDKEALLHDSDDESMLSSHASDFGSPCPQTPTTPSVNPVSTPSSDLFLSPQVPVKRSVKTDLGHAFNQASMTVNEENLGKFETDDTIARRTRSKLPLTTTSLSELESTFVAPDITEDMYDTLCDDSEWQEFLSSLITTDEVTADPQEINDDENNDPEYDYLGEAEHEEKDEEDYRFGRPYRIPKTEMLDLLNQLTEFMASDQEEEEEENKTDTGGDSTETEERHQRRKPLIMTDEFSTSQRLILEDQMRQHVQLSTQLYFLCLGSEDFSSMTEECYRHLHELDMFRQTSLAGSHSVFNACNLNCALQLVTEERQWNLPEELKDIESQSFDDSFSNGTDSEHEGFSVDNNVKRQKAKNTEVRHSSYTTF
ncbi:GON-4-like protein [Patella vulgata]|uniref:GON-4-like protein n=1 Tax=Patella vulgata TaxID=6465 RepID=UPI0024A95998|nr:GON-4-like protein [Patella vulgata]